jgi:RHS repeat-associated protein
VTERRDEAGTVRYRYGKLGVVTEESRTVPVTPDGAAGKTAVMKYRSDYLGRMESIVYPDGEEVTYEYDYGGQIQRVGSSYRPGYYYVTDTGYDEYGQRSYIAYGNGVRTRYRYDPYRRLLDRVETRRGDGGTAYQDIRYGFDKAGNITGYETDSHGYVTEQRYGYDGLYQLTAARGESRSRPYGPGGMTEYVATYEQRFSFNAIGNMTEKESSARVSNGSTVGNGLNYALDYEYYEGTHRAQRIGTRYYGYDGNGNVLYEREGGLREAGTAGTAVLLQEGNRYAAEYGFALTGGEENGTTAAVYEREYRWDERNLLRSSRDVRHTVQYRYGADGERAIKYVEESGDVTLYYNHLWQTSLTGRDGGIWRQSKHVFVGETRVATKVGYEGENAAAEERRVYYYHGDHLGSAQAVTNHEGQLYERLEYTPYGEVWIEWADRQVERNDVIPYRFTGKELDAETGLSYYGARYLDPKTSRWMSADPALGEYVPEAPVNEEARRRNGNLPGMGGVYNYVNLHVYHYAGNNPVKYIDPDGRIVLAITAQWTMQNQPWSNTTIPPDNTTQMWEGGCAITLAGNIAYTHTNGTTTTTPGTIVADPDNFVAEGLQWGIALTDIANLSVGNRINVTNGAAFEAAFNQLDASAMEHYIGIKVNYNDSSDHWVGASAITTRNGRQYVQISRTSIYDSAVTADTVLNHRHSLGWQTEGEGVNQTIYVPLDHVEAYRVFTRTGTTNDQ